MIEWKAVVLAVAVICAVLGVAMPEVPGEWWKWLMTPEAVSSAAVLQVVALYDEKARAFRSPFFVTHVDLAIRAIRGLLSDPRQREAEIVVYADDHVLYHCGTFNDATAEFVTTKPAVVARLASLKPEVQGDLANLQPVSSRAYNLAYNSELRERFDEESA